MDTYKVILLGDARCGKTALIYQFLYSRLIDPETFERSLDGYFRKLITVDDKGSLIEVIDTALQEKYALREGQAFILVYSVTSRATFDRLDILRQDMIRVKGTTPVFMLVGTKCDLVSQREVLHDEGAQLARTFGCEFMETSAKTGQNVELLFSNVVRLLRTVQTSDAIPSQRKITLKGKRSTDKCTIG
ncbi:hypothetical protein PLICRDRAFT_88853 [Plicaturopsis crispa FD-325 SS-3]|nr:hypothetical protein PLICRDRAFT_88853 [Plicaturopsis crispa FD-325 SS-3]